MLLNQHLILKSCINGIRQPRSRSIRPQRRKVKGKKQDQDLRCQSGPSAKDSVILSGGDSSNNYGADQQRLQISVVTRETVFATNPVTPLTNAYLDLVCV